MRKNSAWIAIALALFAVGIHHGWLTVQPLAAGDSPWISSGRLQSYGPWPTIWDPTSGFGGAAFAQAYQAPLEAMWAWLADVGVGFSVQEKLFFFWPFAVLSVLAPWLLARELVGSALWAAVSAAIFATSTHLLLRGAVHLGIATAMCIGVLVFWSDVRAKSRQDPRWAGVTGLLLGLEAIYDIRIAVLTVFCVLFKVVVELVAGPSMRARFTAVSLTSISLVMLGITQLVWLVPLATYRGQPTLPIPSAPFPGFATLAHAFTARDPAWTGGSPVFFRGTVIPWEAYLMPLIAFGTLLLRRIRLEIVWLLLLALAAAFLIKQDLPPFVGVYTWLFQHLPGWDLFRDGTKLSWIVAVAYAVAIPLVAQAAWTRLASRRWLAVGCVAILLAAPAAQVVQASVVTARGDLGETTQSTVEPASFVQLARALDADARPSFVAFVGGTVVWDTTIHRFLLASVTHPDLELSGATHAYDPSAPDNDPLTPFCAGAQTPFCYFQPYLFPYLVHAFGIGYVVAPVGTAVGTLPEGVARAEVVSRLSSLLGGRPVVIGDARNGIALWRVPMPASRVTTSSWIARVHGPSQSLALALPALEALGGPPPIFDGSVAVTQSLPDAIDVVPCIGHRYNIPAARAYAFAIPKGEPFPAQLSIGGQTQRVGRLAESANAILAGPIVLTRGSITIAGVACADPLVTWSKQTAQILTRPDDNEAAVPFRSSGNESVSLSAPKSSWVIYRQGYDREWQLAGSDFHAASGPFNAFHLHVLASSRLTLRFATFPWEAGGAIAAATLTIVLVALLCLPRWRRRGHGESVLSEISLRHSGWWIALLGLACVVIAMIAQALGNAGLTSWLAGPFAESSASAVPSNVYSGPVFYVAMAMAAFLLALGIALVSGRPPKRAADRDTALLMPEDSRSSGLKPRATRGARGPS